LHLIEGSIDQVEGYVSVTWVAPRIMTKPQLAGLKQRLDAWIDKVRRGGGGLHDWVCCYVAATRSQHVGVHALTPLLVCALPAGYCCGQQP
jgi:hypothetical protein